MKPCSWGQEISGKVPDKGTGKVGKAGSGPVGRSQGWPGGGGGAFEPDTHRLFVTRHKRRTALNVSPFDSEQTPSH